MLDNVHIETGKYSNRNFCFTLLHKNKLRGKGMNPIDIVTHKAFALPLCVFNGAYWLNISCYNMVRCIFVYLATC